MKINVALLFCSAPIFGMTEYKPIEMEDMSSPAAENSGDIVARYSDISKILFSASVVEDETAESGYVGRNYASRRNKQRYADAVYGLDQALQADHKPAFLDAAQLALEMDIISHDALMPIITHHANDIEFICQDGLSMADLAGLKLLLKADAINGTYDTKALAIKKITMLDNWLAGKRKFYAQKRYYNVNRAICASVVGAAVADGGCTAGTLALYAPPSVLIGDILFLSGMGTFISGALACSLSVSNGPISRCINKHITDKYSEVQAIFDEILTKNPQFIDGAIAELDTAAQAHDTQAAALLHTIYKNDLLVERNEEKAAHYAQLASLTPSALPAYEPNV